MGDDAGMCHQAGNSNGQRRRFEHHAPFGRATHLLRLALLAFVVLPVHAPLGAQGSLAATNIAAPTMTTRHAASGAPAASNEGSSAGDMARRMQVCAACHGPEGRAASDGYYPRIAGKPRLYLYRQLLNFREQRRGYAPMVHLLRNLTDDYLLEIAGHFASLELPYPAPRPGPTDAATLQRGEALARRGDDSRGIAACSSCHGKTLTGVQPDVPGLLGLPRDYLNAQLGAWRTGLRRALAPDCMARLAQRLDARDVAALSMWLAAQPMPAESRPAPAAPPRHDAQECGAMEATGVAR